MLLIDTLPIAAEKGDENLSLFENTILIFTFNTILAIGILVITFAVMTTESKADIIKLPSSGESLLEDITTQEEVYQKIKEVRAEFDEYTDDTSQYWRNRQEYKEIENEDTCFSVLQFNILAEGLSSGPDVPTPFERTEKSKYGGFTEVPNREICMNFDNRKWLIVEELLCHDADIITVQECDHWEDFFHPVMQIFGYTGCFKAKGDSPCLQFGFYSDGCAILYKKNVWKPISKEISGNYRAEEMILPFLEYIPFLHFLPFLHKIEGQVYLVQSFEHLFTGKKLTVGTTHLKAKCNVVNEGRRTHAIKQLLSKMKTETEAIGSVMVLSADLNADAYTVIEKDETVEPTCVQAIIDSEMLVSAYQLPTNDGDLYTTWKKRGEKESKHAIDYIWHSQSGLQTISFLDDVDDDEMDHSRLPGFRYPSDHVALHALLEFS